MNLAEDNDLSSKESESDFESYNIDERTQVLATILHKAKEERLPKLQFLNSDNVCI